MIKEIYSLLIFFNAIFTCFGVINFQKKELAGFFFCYCCSIHVFSSLVIQMHALTLEKNSVDQQQENCPKICFSESSRSQRVYILSDLASMHGSDRPL